MLYTPSHEARPGPPGPSPSPESGGRLPGFLIGGAQKSGTTTLHRLLERHPRIFFPNRPQELDFFDREESYCRGLDWYRAHFAAAAARHRALGQTSTHYIFEPEPEPEAAARICDPASAARFWARALADGLALESHLGDEVLRVRFEDLVSAPETTLTRIADHAGVDYHPAMLTADGFQPPTDRAQHRLIGRPPDASRAVAWRSRLSSRKVEIFESVAGDLLRHLGYEPRFGPRARPPSRGERLRFALRDLWRRRLLFPVRRRLIRR